MAVIELLEVSKLYGFGDATTLALDEIDLNIDAGEFVAIMGPSGSGKTTLLNLIGLLDRPTHGQYSLQEKQVARLRANQQAKIRRDKIGFVFQAHNLLPKITVLENVALPLAYKGIPPVRRLKQASDMLERVGIRDREYFLPRHLSGGQLQRAVIARALINNPSIIIADEPTGNLDSENSRLVMELLGEIHRQGNTILMVTHNPELTRYASRLLYMKDGSIVGDEATQVGEIAIGAISSFYRRMRSTDDEIAAGVSAMMREIPAKELKSNAKKRRKVGKIRPTKRKIVKKTKKVRKTKK